VASAVGSSLRKAHFFRFFQLFQGLLELSSSFEFEDSKERIICGEVSSFAFQMVLTFSFLEA